MSDIDFITIMLDLLTTISLIGCVILDKWKIEELEWDIVFLENKIRCLEIEVENER